jgi:hypothetical protein
MTSSNRKLQILHYSIMPLQSMEWHKIFNTAKTSGVCLARLSQVYNDKSRVGLSRVEYLNSQGKVDVQNTGRIGKQTVSWANLGNHMVYWCTVPTPIEGKSSSQINNKMRKFMGCIWNFHKTLKVGPVYMLKFPIPHDLMNIVLVSGYPILDKPFYAKDNLLPLASIQASTLCCP